jgi:hypothetical protein
MGIEKVTEINMKIYKKKNRDFFIVRENLVVRKIDEMTNGHEIAVRKI